MGLGLRVQRNVYLIATVVGTLLPQRKNPNNRTQIIGFWGGQIPLLL